VLIGMDDAVAEALGQAHFGAFMGKGPKVGK